MADDPQWQRGDHSVVPGSWVGGTTGYLTVGELYPSPPQGAAIERSISFPSVTVTVGAPGAGTPAEGWWTQIVINWFIWSAHSLGTSPPNYGDDPDVLFLGKLYPTLVASPSAPTEYYVVFKGPDTGFQSHGKRRAPAGTPQVMCTGMRWEDPLNGLDPVANPSMAVYTRSTDICLFHLAL